MIDSPIRSPRAKLGDLHHIGRLFDKIQSDLAGTLPKEYLENLGLAVGSDGFLCGLLGVKFEDVSQKVFEGLSDEELVEWRFPKGLRPNPMQRRIWKGFSEKFGQRDMATSAIETFKEEDGLKKREDILTAFDLIDEQEARSQND